MSPVTALPALDMLWEPILPRSMTANAVDHGFSLLVALAHRRTRVAPSPSPCTRGVTVGPALRKHPAPLEPARLARSAHGADEEARGQGHAPCVFALKRGAELEGLRAAAGGEGRVGDGVGLLHLGSVSGEWGKAQGRPGPEWLAGARGRQPSIHGPATPGRVTRQRPQLRKLPCHHSGRASRQRGGRVAVTVLTTFSGRLYFADKTLCSASPWRAVYMTRIRSPGAAVVSRAGVVRQLRVKREVGSWPRAGNGARGTRRRTTTSTAHRVGCMR